MAARLLRAVAIYVGLVAAMLAGVVLATAIPSPAIQRHVSATIPQSDYEKSPLGGVQNNFTECIALSVGLRRVGDNALQQSLLSPTAVDCERYDGYVSGTDAGRLYWRFWHGYQLVSRPLLYFRDIYTLRTVAFLGVFLSLIFFLARLASRLQSPRLAAAVAIGLLCVPFAAGTYQIAEAIVWVLGFLAAGLLVAAPGRSEGIVRENATTFMVVGMLTSYLGLLGTPIVTLTVPLMAVAFSHADERGGRRLAPRFILFATAWSVGYLACWAAKWVLVAVFTDAPGIVEEVVDQIRFRLSGGVPALGDAVPTVSGSILANLGEVRTGLVLTGLLIAASLPRIVRACRGGRPDSDVAGATLLVFALPFLWLAVVRNHSTIHSPFVAPILFTGFAIVAGFCLAPGHFLRRPVSSGAPGAATDRAA